MNEVDMQRVAGLP